MTTGISTRIKLPDTVTAGESFTIKTQITHRMENGFRFDHAGNRIPRDIVYRFECLFEGEAVIEVAIEPGIASNPFFEFDVRIPHSGVLQFTWHSDEEGTHTETRSIMVR